MNIKLDLVEVLLKQRMEKMDGQPWVIQKSIIEDYMTFFARRCDQWRPPEGCSSKDVAEYIEKTTQWYLSFPIDMMTLFRRYIAIETRQNPEEFMTKFMDEMG